MKKFLIIALALLCVFMICSCSPEKEVDATSEVVMLDFDANKSITGFSSNNPFTEMREGMEGSNITDYFSTGGFWMAAGAMQNLPIIPNLKIAKLDKVNAEFAKEKVVDAYGFPLSVDSTVSKADSNSVFVRYYIYDFNDKKMEKGRVGQIDYYYDIKNGTISYREVLTPFFDSFYAYGQSGGDNIFVFELLDVPVKISKNGNGVETISFNVTEAGKYQLIDYFFGDKGKEDPETTVPYTVASINKFDVLMNFSQTTNNGGTKECTVYSTVFDHVTIPVTGLYDTPITTPRGGKDSLDFALSVLPQGISKPFKDKTFSKERIDSGTGTLAKDICDIFAYTISPKVKKGAMIYSGHGSRIKSDNYISSVDVIVKNGSANEFAVEFGYPQPENSSESFNAFMTHHLKNCGVSEQNISSWLTSRGY